MKTEKQINDARGVLHEHLHNPGLSDAQRTLLRGMLNALAWSVDGKHSSSVDRLMSGEQIRAGLGINQGGER